MPTPLRAIALSAMLLVAACAPVGEYVWVDALNIKGAGESEYLIEPGDVISVKVFGQENMSGRVRVRSDGRISLPFINDHVAAGLAPGTLARFLETQFKSYVVNPVVTVSLEEQHPIQVSVLGEVARPGVYRLEPGQGVLHAVALAGGLSQFADRERIFVIRRTRSNGDGAAKLRIRFKWSALTRADGKAASFLLQDADVLVVE
jgi:polysaccharide export outer membrane protein